METLGLLEEMENNYKTALIVNEEKLKILEKEPLKSYIEGANSVWHQPERDGHKKKDCYTASVNNARREIEISTKIYQARLDEIDEFKKNEHKMNILTGKGILPAILRLFADTIYGYNPNFGMSFNIKKSNELSRMYRNSELKTHERYRSEIPENIEVILA